MRTQFIRVLPSLKPYIACLSASLMLVATLVSPALAQNGSFYTPPANTNYNSNTNLPPLQPLRGTNYNSPDGYSNYNTNVNSGYNQPAANSYNYGAGQTLQGQVSTAPAGSQIAATVNQTISSEFARVGDRVVLQISTPLYGGNQMVLPVGSQIEGQVTGVKDAGRAGGNGELEIRFNQAVTPNGQRMPIAARIATEDGSGVLKGGTTKGRLGKAAGTAAIGAGAGALLGTALGPLSGGSVGRGAIYGTALGATAGAAGALLQKGKPAELTAGSPVTLVLEQPLSAGSGGDYGYGNSYNSNYNNSNNNSYNYGY